MFTIHFTIGRNFNNPSRSSVNLVHPKISTSRNPVGYQSGLFGEEKMLYEKQHRIVNRPKMVVEQIAEPHSNAILLPGMDREEIFRPLWVTVPQKDLPVKTQFRLTTESLKSLSDIRKVLSVFSTWMDFVRNSLSNYMSTVKVSLNGSFRMPQFGFQPALFDAAPIASMEKARYIASRESFASARGVHQSSAWKFPTLKFVVTVPTKSAPRPRSEADSKPEEVKMGLFDNNHDQNARIQKISYKNTLPYQRPTQQTNSPLASLGELKSIHFYLIGASAVAVGFILNFFFLH